MQSKEEKAAKMRAYYAANKAKKKAYYAANKEEIAVRQKAYYEANKEELIAKQTSYNAANKEKIASRAKAYYEANKEELIAKQKAYYEANRQEHTDRKRVYNKKNPHVGRTFNTNSRCKKLYNIEEKLSVKDVKNLFEAQPSCQCCGSTKKLELDHVQPLSKGGANTIDNIQVLCKICNMKKGVTNVDYRADRKGGEISPEAPGPWQPVHDLPELQSPTKEEESTLRDCSDRR